MIDKRQKPEYKEDKRNFDQQEFEELKKWVNAKKIEDGINAKIRIICISSTMTFLSFCTWLGNIIYDKSYAIEAAVKAFWAASKGGNP